MAVKLASCPTSIEFTHCTYDSGSTLADSALYTYDRVGSRTDHSAVIGTGDRPSSFDGYSLTWDHAGRLTQKSGNGLTENYYWSATGRLDSVTARDTTWRFTYDGFGRRIKRARDGWSAQFLWDGGNLFMSLSGSGGTLEATYSNLPGLDAPLAQTRGSSTSYYATDDLGSVEGLFDGSGVQNQDRYDPWGEPQVATGSVTNPLRYAGLPWNGSTGLTYMRARYYDPGLGRFISEDPLGLSAGINPYAYVGNSPTNGTDPSGLCQTIFYPDGDWFTTCPPLPNITVAVTSPWSSGGGILDRLLGLDRSLENGPSALDITSAMLAAGSIPGGSAVSLGLRAGRYLGSHPACLAASEELGFATASTVAFGLSGGLSGIATTLEAGSEAIGAAGAGLAWASGTGDVTGGVLMDGALVRSFAGPTASSAMEEFTAEPPRVHGRPVRLSLRNSVGVS